MKIEDDEEDSSNPPENWVVIILASNVFPSQVQSFIAFNASNWGILNFKFPEMFEYHLIWTMSFNTSIVICDDTAWKNLSVTKVTPKIVAYSKNNKPEKLISEEKKA